MFIPSLWYFSDSYTIYVYHDIWLNEIVRFYRLSFCTRAKLGQQDVDNKVKEELELMKCLKRNIISLYAMVKSCLSPTAPRADWHPDFPMCRKKKQGFKQTTLFDFRSIHTLVHVGLSCRLSFIC